jgi:hypothetical protein
MGIPRSTFYDAPAIAAGDDEILTSINSICDGFEAYGYRRVGAVLRQQGVIVNSKKVRRLMREHGLQPSAGAGSSLRRTAITTARSLPISPRTSRLMGRTSSGSPT